MKMKDFKKRLAVIAVLLITALSIKPAIAYFTAYTQAEGERTIHLSGKTDIEEIFSFDNWTKTVTIENTEGEDVFIRVKAFAGETYKLTVEGEGWEEKDGWWYFESPVAAGASTKDLNVKIEGVEEADPENTDFNVAIVYESAPVRYSADDEPYADWDAKLDTGTLTGGETDE